MLVIALHSAGIVVRTMIRTRGSSDVFVLQYVSSDGLTKEDVTIPFDRHNRSLFSFISYSLVYLHKYRAVAYEK